MLWVKYTNLHMIWAGWSQMAQYVFIFHDLAGVRCVCSIPPSGCALPHGVVTDPGRFSCDFCFHAVLLLFSLTCVFRPHRFFQGWHVCSGGSSLCSQLDLHCYKRQCGKLVFSLILSSNALFRAASGSIFLYRPFFVLFIKQNHEQAHGKSRNNREKPNNLATVMHCL